MKKNTVIIIALISIIAFLGLVYYGLKHSRGIPTAVEKQKRVVLKVPFVNTGIDLSKGISLDKWDSIPSEEIELLYQVMVLPWGKSVMSPIFVKAFHNNKDIYFYIKWNDDTANKSVEMNKFSDACAVMFPMDDKVQPSTLMMGFLGKANIWHWKASRDEEYWSKIQPETGAYVDFYYPFEEKELFEVSKEIPQSAVNDLMAIRVGTITPKELQNVQGRGYWIDGTWYVVIKRSLKSVDPELDAIFNIGKNRLCAFAVWNGENGDRGGRKSISDWVELEVKG